jgi:hypothetical protein
MTFTDSADISLKTETVETPLRVLPDVNDAKAAAVEAERYLDKLKSQKEEYIKIRNAELKLLGAEDILGYALLKEEGIELEMLKDELPLEVTVAKIGDICVACTQGEMFVEYGLKIKADSPYPKTMVFELCNGAAPGYIYTKEALEIGGYETDTSLLDAGCGENIVESILKLLNEV